MFSRNDVNIGDWHENKARHEQSRFNAVIVSLEAISSLKKDCHENNGSFSKE
jgi:hypothetical protein